MGSCDMMGGGPVVEVLVIAAACVGALIYSPFWLLKKGYRAIFPEENPANDTGQEENVQTTKKGK